MKQLSDYTKESIKNESFQKGGDLAGKTFDTFTEFGETLAHYGVMACKVSLSKNMEKGLKGVDDKAIDEGIEYGENLAKIVKHEKKLLLNNMIVKFALNMILGIILAASFRILSSNTVLLILLLSVGGCWIFKDK